MNGNSTRDNGNPVAPNEKSRVLAKVYAYILSWQDPPQGESVSQGCSDEDRVDSSKSE
jgi:hypothetical protein